MFRDALSDLWGVSSALLHSLTDLDRRGEFHMHAKSECGTMERPAGSDRVQ